MVLSHRINREERNQINRILIDLSVLLAGKDHADEVLKRFMPLKSGGWPRGMLCSFRMTGNRGTKSRFIVSDGAIGSSNPAVR
jgi:hypothetical protein